MKMFATSIKGNNEVSKHESEVNASELWKSEREFL
jgi:hypothetical protein